MEGRVCFGQGRNFVTNRQIDRQNKNNMLSISNDPEA